MQIELTYTPKDSIYYIESIDITNRKINIKKSTIESVSILGLKQIVYQLKNNETITDKDIICMDYELYNHSNKFGLYFDQFLADLVKSKDEYLKTEKINKYK